MIKGAYVKKINILNDLNIPNNYKSFIQHFMINLSSLENIERVILFGSCAREDVDDKYSDIDMLVLTNNSITLDEEFYIMNDCTPSIDYKYYVPSDIIVNSIQHYNKYKDEFGMLQKQIEREGIDISELLR